MESERSARRRELAAARLTERQMLCLSLYWFDGMTLTAIGRELSMTSQAVERLIRKGTARLEAIGLRPRELCLERKPEMILMELDMLDGLKREQIRTYW